MSITQHRSVELYLREEPGRDLQTAQLSGNFRNFAITGSFVGLVGLDKRRYDAIDALRAVAVLLVLIYHLTARFPTDYTGLDHQIALPWRGILGVFLFFIVSGYCIAMTAEKAESVWKFWLHRFTRLQPAFVVCIAITLGVVAVLGLPGRETSVADGVRNVLWFPIFSKTPLVDGVYWSLMEEAKFYFVFGILFYSFRSRILTAFACFTAIGAFIHFSGWLNAPSQLIFPFKDVARSYFFFPYSLFFLAGIAARRSGFLAQAAVFSAVSAAFWMVWGNTLFTVLAIAIAIIGMVGVQVRGAQIWRPITYLGLISYPLYLLHQNVGISLIRFLGPYISDSYLRIAIAAGVVLALAALVSWSVEHRFRHWLEATIVGAVSRALPTLPRWLSLNQRRSSLRPKPITPVPVPVQPRAPTGSFQGPAEE